MFLHDISPTISIPCYETRLTCGSAACWRETLVGPLRWLNPVGPWESVGAEDAEVPPLGRPRFLRERGSPRDGCRLDNLAQHQNGKTPHLHNPEPYPHPINNEDLLLIIVSITGSPGLKNRPAPKPETANCGGSQSGQG